MHLLGLPGSLRAASINRAMLQAAARLAPLGVSLDISDQIATLPLFNPDHEAEPIAAVLGLRAAIATADGVVIACPEYAHGVPGAFKNALDWVVASGEFVDKPFVLFHANGSRAAHARVAVVETLMTMNAWWVRDATVELALTSAITDADAICTDPDNCTRLRAGLEGFVAGIRTAQAIKAKDGMLPIGAERPLFPVP